MVKWKSRNRNPEKGGGGGLAKGVMWGMDIFPGKTCQMIEMMPGFRHKLVTRCIAAQIGRRGQHLTLQVLVTELEYLHRSSSAKC